VDFGFWLGKDTLFFQHVAGPVRLDLKEIKTVVGEDTPRAFFDTLRLAFTVLRSQVHLLFEQMCVAGELDIAQFGGSSSGRVRARVRAWLEERCQPCMGKTAAGRWIEMIVTQCADAPSDLLRDTTHGFAIRRAQFQKEVVPAISSVMSKVAQSSAEVVSGTLELALEGRESLARMLYDSAADGQKWERATACCICGRTVARSFVEWAKHGRRHHCRICRRTVCDRRDCSLLHGSEDRRCKNCLLRNAQHQNLAHRASEEASAKWSPTSRCREVQPCHPGGTSSQQQEVPSESSESFLGGRDKKNKSWGSRFRSAQEASEELD
jgi:hypothetical protein